MTTSVVPSLHPVKLKELELITPDELDSILSNTDERFRDKILEVTGLGVQEPLICNGLDYAAYAFTALGYDTTVDDILNTLSTLSNNKKNATNEVLELEDFYNVSQQFIEKRNLPIFVECYRFDNHVVTSDDFSSACKKGRMAGVDVFVILNFSSHISLGLASSQGDQYSLVVAADSQSDRLVLANIHGSRYDTFWSVPFQQLFESIVGKEPCTHVRGVLRFGKTSCKADLRYPIRELQPTLYDSSVPLQSKYSLSDLNHYTPERFDEGLGVRNLEGVIALAAAMKSLERLSSKAARLDEIIHAIQGEYTYYSGRFYEADYIKNLATKLLERNLTKAIATVYEVSGFSEKEFHEKLKVIGCGEEGVAVIVSHGYEASDYSQLKMKNGETKDFSYGRKSWSLITGFSSNDLSNSERTMIIVPARNIAQGDSSCAISLGRLNEDIEKFGGGKIVVLDSRKDRSNVSRHHD